MGLFDWLFGTKPRWQLSENGNPMMLIHGARVTVFERDGGWKFCISNGEQDSDPLFSDPYETDSAAKYEALALLNGTPSRYRTIYQVRRERRRASHAP